MQPSNYGYLPANYNSVPYNHGDFHLEHFITYGITVASRLDIIWDRIFA